MPPVSDAWGDALHGFGWLADLNESASRLSSSNARALVDEWLAGGHAHKGADAPHLVAARLTSWLAYSPLLNDRADTPIRKRLMRAVGRHCRQLEKALALRQGDALTLSAALALAGLCSEGLARVRRTGLAALEDALSAAILPDGGHASRSPAAIADALRTLPHRTLIIALGVVGLMVGISGLQNMQLLLIIFGALSVSASVSMLRESRIAKLTANQRIIAHFSGLIGTGIGAYTALFAFGGSRLLSQVLSGQWQVIPWIAPAIIGTIAIRRTQRQYQQGGAA